jgi:2-keto-4-pentenoate hydratase/2-oxohepta-3-ene-1,7-dioic acid hydratase (catechol pathway)
MTSSKLPIRETCEKFELSRLFDVRCGNVEETPEKGLRWLPAAVAQRDCAELSTCEGSIFCEREVLLRGRIAILFAIGTHLLSPCQLNFRPTICAFGVAVDFLFEKTASKGRVEISGDVTATRISQHVTTTELVPASCFSPEDNLIWLDLNNEPVREMRFGDIANLMPKVLLGIDGNFGLRQGDLIMVSPPQNALQLKPSDILRGGMEGLSSFRLRIEGRLDRKFM